MFVDDAHQENDSKHAKHRQLEAEISLAMDEAKFEDALNKLVAQGMKPEMVKIFSAQFQGLLAAVKTENNRLTTWMPI